MPNPIKISFLSGIILLPLAMGCAATNSHTTVSPSLSAEIAATPSSKRMLLIAENFENQGHKDGARLAYEDLKKAYPYSEDAKLAELRIVALTSNPAKLAADANLPEPKKSVELAAEMVPARIVGEDASAPFLLTAETSVAQKSPESEEQLPFPEIITVSAEEPATTQKSENIESAPAFLFEAEPEVKTESPRIVTWRGSKPEFAWASSGWKSTSQKKSPHKSNSVVPYFEEETSDSSEPRLYEPIRIPSPVNLENLKQDKLKPDMHQLAWLAYEVGNEESPSPATIVSLKQLLDHEDAQVRLNSAEALYKLGHGNAQALQVLQESMQSADENLQFVATFALASVYRHSESDALALMVRQLKENKPQIQRQVVLMLGEYQEHKSELVPVLEQLIVQTPSAEIKEAAQLSLDCLAQ